MRVFGYFYNSCTYESADGLVSLHTTREGAQAALETGKCRRYQRWLEENAYWQDDDVSLVEDTYSPPEWQVHSIHEIEVQHV